MEWVQMTRSRGIAFRAYYYEQINKHTQFLNCQWKMNQKNFPYPSPQKLRKLSRYNYTSVIKVVYIWKYKKQNKPSPIYPSLLVNAKVCFAYK